jgi:IS5 family transposase
MYAERDKQLSFYDEPIYSQTVPFDHFLRKLNVAIDFTFVNELCKELYCPDNGRPSWEPQLLFKALFLQFLYNLNDYTVEDEINDRMSFKYFLGLPVNEKGPDHSTLFKFRDRLGTERFSQIFNKIVEVARAHKLISNKLYIVDSTDVKAKVDMFRVTEEIQKSKNENGNDSNPNDGGGFTTPDTDAKFGRKSKNKKFYGYKEHLCMDAESEIIVGRKTTPGNEPDGDHFQDVIPDESLPKVATADKSYDDKKNHEYLKENGIRNGIILKKNHTKEYTYPQRKSIVARKYRPLIEHKNAELKRWHLLSRARFWGIARVSMQCCLTAIVVNCKRIVKLLFSLAAPPKLCLRAVCRG